MLARPTRPIIHFANEFTPHADMWLNPSMRWFVGQKPFLPIAASRVSQALGNDSLRSSNTANTHIGFIGNHTTNLPTFDCLVNCMSIQLDAKRQPLECVCIVTLMYLKFVIFLLRLMVSLLFNASKNLVKMLYLTAVSLI